MKKLFLAGMLLVGMAGMAFSQENYLTWPTFKNIILNTKASGAPITNAQVNFPVLVRLGARDSAVFISAQTAGQDIRFANAAGKHLPYQIQQWNATRWTAVIWVLLDTVKANDSSAAIKM